MNVLSLSETGTVLPKSCVPNSMKSQLIFECNPVSTRRTLLLQNRIVFVLAYAVKSAWNLA